MNVELDIPDDNLLKVKASITFDSEAEKNAFISFYKEWAEICSRGIINPTKRPVYILLNEPRAKKLRDILRILYFIVAGKLEKPRLVEMFEC